MAQQQPVWFISGASSGFGLEIAKAALSRGHTVVASARSTQRLTELAKLGAHTIAFDVTSPFAEIATIVEDVYAKHGRVDYLINAAGYVLDGAVEELDAQEVQACFKTNVFGPVNTIKAFLPRLRAQEMGANGSRATIAVFGSLASWGGTASASIYCMTKASTSSLAESLVEELKPFDIAVTTIEPGYFRTSFLNPGVRVTAKQQMDEYVDESTPSGQVRKALTSVDNKQPGDVVKGAAVAVEVLTRTGRANGKLLPVRIVLGTDADGFIRNKVTSTLALLDEWKDLIYSTDYPEGQ